YPKILNRRRVIIIVIIFLLLFKIYNIFTNYYNKELPAFENLAFELTNEPVYIHLQNPEKCVLKEADPWDPEIMKYFTKLDDKCVPEIFPITEVKNGLLLYKENK